MMELCNIGVEATTVARIWLRPPGSVQTDHAPERALRRRDLLANAGPVAKWRPTEPIIHDSRMLTGQTTFRRGLQSVSLLLTHPV
jgi:hypothetical protein